jgi:thymidylate synthase
MYVPVPTVTTCAQAWVAAASALVEQGDSAFNVIIDVEKPVEYTQTDNAVISMVDGFLRRHDVEPISTVANTIFPHSIFLAHGSPRFYDVYLRGFDRLSETKQWGRYFERLTRHQTADGTWYNPLQALIEKLRDNTGDRTYSSAYELAVYDPLRDSRFLRGGQCLSFLSFKVNADRGLNLTVMYRNHTYITRCLGNLIGLGRLQSFVASESNLAVGSLTCVSTHAVLDTGPGWGIRDARNLISNARSLLSEHQDIMIGAR